MQIGVYNELNLQRLDLIFAEAGKNGVRIIFPFVNYVSFCDLSLTSRHLRSCTQHALQDLR